MAPCAQWPKAWDMSISEWLQSAELKDIQDRFTRDNYFQPECAKCEYNAKLGKTYDWHSQKKRDSNKFYIDFTPDNRCNLSCLMCSPDLSTGVGKEYQKIGWIDKIPEIDNYDQLLQYLTEIDRNDIKIAVCGGEPFMNPRFADILELIRDRGWGVIITTNASLRHKRAMDALRGIKDLTLEFSADGVGTSYEAIRWPMSWDKWVKNFKYYIDHMSSRTVNSVTIRYVVNFFNAQDFSKMCLFAQEHRVIISSCLLSWPEWMTWSVLTDDERAVVVEQLEVSKNDLKLEQHQQYLDQIIDYVKEHSYIEDHRLDFIQRYTTLCKSRNIDPTMYLQHLPTLAKEFK